MRIKRRDGTMAEVGDGYVLQDGESFTRPLMMMDSRSMITDGRGHVAGSRPGFLFADDDVADAVRETNYQNYRDGIGQRWKSDRWQTRTKPAPSASPRFSGGDAVAAAHAQYRADIESRWRR